MAREIISGNNVIDALECAVIAILLVATNVQSLSAPIPANPSQVASWFQANVKPLASRKGSVNATLAKAEANPRIIKVRKDGSGQFKTLTDAIKSIPTGNSQRVIVDIGPGIYTEKVTIDRSKPFITLYGNPKNMPTLSFGGTAKEYGTVYSATLQVEADFFTAANIIIKNSAPRPDGVRVGAQAVAFRIGGDKASFYNCKFLGFQDTVCDDRGRHFFKDCYIEGTVDFIFGSGKSLYLGTQLHVIADKWMTVITAQARDAKSQDIGFSFVHCRVTGTATGAFLGRAWMPMPQVVFAYSTMSSAINPAGWTNNNHPERDSMVLFGEYHSSGPGATPQARAKFSKQLTAAEVQPYISLDYIQGSEWLLPPPTLSKKK